MTCRLPQPYQPLELETRFTVETANAAFHCNRRPQTLRTWACYENGPIRPIRIHGRLAWLVSDIRRLVGCDPTNSTKTKSQTDLLNASVANSTPDSNNSGEQSCQE